MVRSLSEIFHLRTADKDRVTDTEKNKGDGGCQKEASTIFANRSRYSTRLLNPVQGAVAVAAETIV